MPHPRTSWPLAAGALLSVALHLAVAAALGALEDAGSAGISLDPPAEPPRERTRLGIENSRESTATWIGYEEYRSHVARPAEFDQAAMMRTPTSNAAIPRPDAPASSRATPQNDPDETARTPTPAPKPAEDLLASRTEPDDADSLRAPTRPEALGPPIPDAEKLIPAERLASAPAPNPAPTEDRPASTPGEPAESDQPAAAEPADADAPPPPAPAPAEPESIENARPADKDAPATSIETALEVEPGKPLAARGLDIKTIRPQWSHYTRLTASPRNPIAEIRFDRDGRVYNARLLRSTGRDDVDGPLIDSLYRWRAEGKELEQLSQTPEGEPPQTIRFVLTIKLR